MSQVQSDNERFRRAYIRACMLIGLFTFPAMLGLAVTARPFVAVVLGERWLPVAGLLTVFGPVGMIQSVSTTVGLIFNAKGRADWNFRWGGVCSILFVISFLIGLPWGIMGVAISYSIMFSLVLIPTFLIPFRLIELPGIEFFRHLWPELKASLVMALIVFVWLNAFHWPAAVNALTQLVTSVAIGVVSYVLLLLWWKPPVLNEFRNLLEESGNPLAAKLARHLSRFLSPANH